MNEMEGEWVDNDVDTVVTFLFGAAVGVLLTTLVFVLVGAL